MSDPGRTDAQERWLRFFNKVVYRSMAPAYDAMDLFTFGAWWRLVRHALEHVPDDRDVLEVGFGPGKLHLELARRSSRCTGLDYSPDMCRFARRRVLEAGLEANITRGTAHSLPFADESFDCVVSTFALSGLSEPDTIMAELARVLRPGGRVVVIDIALPKDDNPVGRSLARLWERMGDYLHDFPSIMEKAGLRESLDQEFGPGRHIRALVGIKPDG
jgi:ubiquinone/menaquinone biosynthesis C-methylase UbiE